MLQEDCLKPYYNHNGICIFHGDANQILPSIETIDLILTDPPYGIDFGESGGFSSSSGWKFSRGNSPWDKERPKKETFDKILNAAPEICIWGGNYFADLLPPSMGWLIWDKGQRNFSLSDAELAWTSRNNAVRIFEYSRGAAVNDGKEHPTQKPLALMKWCLTFFPDSQIVCDPFMGSGTTLRAAKDLNKQAIGIEIEERYCEIAAKRLSQEVFDFGGVK